LEPGAGVLNSAMRALFLLSYATHQQQQTLDKSNSRFLIKCFAIPCQSQLGMALEYFSV